MKHHKKQKPSLKLADEAAQKRTIDQFRQLSRKKLINSLNRIHFNDGSVSLLFRHAKYYSTTSLDVHPQACTNENLHCLWNTPATLLPRLKFYTFENFSFTDGLKQIQVPARLVGYDAAGVNLELPDQSYEIVHRMIRRFGTGGIQAIVTQEGWLKEGEMLNYSAQSFAIRFPHGNTLLKNEIDQRRPVYVVLKKDGDFLFSGTCQILRQTRSPDTKTLVLRPLTEHIRRVKSKNMRSERMVPTPIPTIAFIHPVIEKKFHLGLHDISGQGFSVEEDIRDSVLLPGMIIPEMEIQFMHGFSVRCRAQALYRIPRGDVVKCGFVILDMNMKDHLKYSSFIHQAQNRHSCLSTTHIDLEALWDFFFESGFIYPEKYRHIAEQKEEFIATFDELYNEHPEIVRHLTYQDKGKIYGHISIHRYYQKTWMMHHLAAIKSPKHKAGLVVLEGVLKLISELHSMPSAKMDYLIGFFRPNNRFSSRLFGPRTVETINDLNKCSVDEFAYFYLPRKKTRKPARCWELVQTDTADLTLLNHWYDRLSGGLSLRALDLTPEKCFREKEVNDEYCRAGFRRDRKLFSLKKNDELIAVFIVNISDFGLNMSDLTSCIQVLVLDETQMPAGVLQFAINRLSKLYDHRNIPILVYPKSSIEEKQIPFEKSYMLGILNLEYISDYLDFENSMTSSSKSVAMRHA